MSVFWMVGFENTFTFDDFTNILRVTDASYGELFRLFPQATYNDRSMGDVLVKALYTLFGLEPQGYHVVFVAIHFFNCYLIYKIMKIVLFDKYQEKAYLGAVIATGVFGIYPVSLMAPSWIAAEFDVICMPLYLLAIYCFLQYIAKEKKNLWYAAGVIICYYLALRSKEMAITLPVLFVMYELYRKWTKDRTYKVSKLSWVTVVIMILYFGMIISGEKLPDMNENHPYYQSFNPIDMLIVAIKYLFFYFDWGTGNFSFIEFSKNSVVGVVLFIGIVIYSVFKCIKDKEFGLILSIICIGIALAPVLPMVNTQHRLYFYMPSMYIGLMFALVLLELFAKCSDKILYYIAISFVVLIYLCNFLPGPVAYKNMWLHFCKKDAFAIEYIKEIEAPPKGSTVYVKGASEGYNVFFYGPGNSLRLFWDDKELKVELVDTFPEDIDENYIFLEYTTDGRVLEVQRGNN